MSNATKSLTLKYFVAKNFSLDILRDENILSRTIYTWKYLMMNFFPNYGTLDVHAAAVQIKVLHGYSKIRRDAWQIHSIDRACMT